MSLSRETIEKLLKRSLEFNKYNYCRSVFYASSYFSSDVDLDFWNNFTKKLTDQAPKYNRFYFCRLIRVGNILNRKLEYFDLRECGFVFSKMAVHGSASILYFFCYR